jgi:outer membrane protein TolC
VTGGWRFGDADGFRYGYVAGVSVNLPVFSRGQGLSSASRVRLELLNARIRAAERNMSLKLGRAQRLARFAGTELERFETATSRHIEQLERAAQSGYREGHRTIVELLDARQTRTRVELRRLELMLTRKRAELELRAARGDFE